MFLLPLLALAGCSASTSGSGGPTYQSAPAPKSMNIPVSRDKTTFDFSRASALAQGAASLVKSQNDFGARLIAHLEDGNTKRENLLASPTSLWQALALTQTGARGQTKVELQKLLALESLPDARIGEGNRAFNELLAEQKGASISVANSAWFGDNFAVNPAFKTGAQNDFGAGIESFAANKPAETATRVNDWVSDHTQKEIPQIVTEDDVTGQAALLVNAVYFRGGWKSPFDKARTKPAPFHLADGKTTEAAMMNREIGEAFLGGKTFEGARLPYENTGCALWVLLPNKGQMPSDVLKELALPTSQKLRSEGSVQLSLPRFEVTWKKKLNPELQSLGAKTPFGDNADFSGIGTPTAAISAVIHVCKMRVDEEGTVAAAATVVAVEAGAAPAPQTPKKLVFDRPFVVALVEETSGARLFEGVIYEPTK